MAEGMVLLAIGSVPAAIITALASAIVQKRQGRKTGRRLGSR